MTSLEGARDLHEFEKEQIVELKLAFTKDIALALSNFKVWLLLSILSNIVLIGLPALYVFFNTANVAQTALKVAQQNDQRLDQRSGFMNRTDGRLLTIERYLKNQQMGFEPYLSQEPQEASGR